MLEKKDTIEHEIKDNKCETIRLSNLSNLVNYTWFAGFVWLKEKKKKEKCIAIHHEKEKKETNLSIQDVLPFIEIGFIKLQYFIFSVIYSVAITSRTQLQTLISSWNALLLCLVGPIRKDTRLFSCRFNMLAATMKIWLRGSLCI